jgi:hypothetical protein
MEILSYFFQPIARFGQKALWLCWPGLRRFVGFNLHTSIPGKTARARSGGIRRISLSGKDGNISSNALDKLAQILYLNQHMFRHCHEDAAGVPQPG